MGTLDTLILLSDELAKADNYGESIVRKVANYTLDVLDGNKQQMVENLTLSNNQQPNCNLFNFKKYLKYFSKLSMDGEKLQVGGGAVPVANGAARAA